MKSDSNDIIEDTYSGSLFRLKDLQTEAGTLKLLKIRKYDKKHLDLGDADLPELMEDENEVGAYFSNPPLDEELGIK